MTTSNQPTRPTEVAARQRGAPRLALADVPGENRLDGGWWPRSRDLAVELADLVDHFPSQSARIVRAVFSPPDWDARPRLVRVARGNVKVGWFPRDDTHLILLSLSDRSVLRILVVPPELSRDQGEEALLAAATAGNSHSAADLLAEVMDSPEVDRRDLWTDHPAGTPAIAPARTPGQRMAFVVETDSSDEAAWWLVEDDRVIAWAGRTFSSLAHADQAAHDFRVTAEAPDYRVDAEGDDRWSWAAWGPDGVRVAVGGDTFADEGDARDAAQWVRQHSRTAMGP